MNYSSAITISKTAYQTNIEFIQNMVGEDCLISAVVKGNAYGHGIETFVPMAYSTGLRHFSVFSAQEASRVLDVLPGDADLMIMGHLDPDDVAWAVTHDLSFFVFDLVRLKRAIRSAKAIGKPAKIHLELETGMNRTGLEKEELKAAVKIIKADKKHLELSGVCTHLAGAESISNHFRVKKQLKKFEKLVAALAREGLKFEKRHTACSAAAIRYPSSRMDMVRIGILQYGLWPSREILVHYLERNKSAVDPLKRLLQWTSKVLAIKEVKRGDFIGYGTSYFTQEDKRIAIVPVGYSNGYSRGLSNTGRVLIRGKLAPVLGMINMNLLAADVSAIAEVNLNEEVVIIGDQQDQSISVRSFTDLSDQLNYELLSRIPQDIPRKIIA